MKTPPKYLALARQIAGSLLTSDLTNSDLREAGRLLESEPRIWHDVARILAAAVAHPGSREVRKSGPLGRFVPQRSARPANPYSSTDEQLYRAIARRRKGRQEVIRLLSSVAPQLRSTLQEQRSLE